MRQAGKKRPNYDIKPNLLHYGYSFNGFFSGYAKISGI
jgi:hypothetical protein